MFVALLPRGGRNIVQCNHSKDRNSTAISPTPRTNSNDRCTTPDVDVSTGRLPHFLRSHSNVTGSTSCPPALHIANGPGRLQYRKTGSGRWPPGSDRVAELQRYRYHNGMQSTSLRGRNIGTSRHSLTPARSPQATTSGAARKPRHVPLNGCCCTSPPVQYATSVRRRLKAA